jgi:hypothetical protein
MHVDVPKWQTFFQSPLKLVPKVKVSCLNLNEVEGGEAPNNFVRPEITGSILNSRGLSVSTVVSG